MSRNSVVPVVGVMAVMAIMILSQLPDRQADADRPGFTAIPSIKPRRLRLPAQQPAQVTVPAAKTAQPSVSSDESPPEQVLLAGLVEAAETFRYEPSFSEIVSFIGAEVGHPVVAGQVLCAFDDTDLKLAILESELSIQAQRHEVEGLRYTAQASLAEAGEPELARVTVLVKAAEVRIEEALTALERLKQQHARYVVKAPFSGVVRSVTANPGEFVARGANVLQLSSRRRVIRARIPRRAVTLLNDAKIAARDGRQWVDVTVKTVVPERHADGSQTVLFDLPDKSQVIPGTDIDIRVLAGTAETQR